MKEKEKTIAIVKVIDPSKLKLLSGSILDVYSGEQGISPVNTGLMNASCPSILPMKKEIAETDTRALAKERQKKDNHNLMICAGTKEPF